MSGSTSLQALLSKDSTLSGLLQHASELNKIQENLKAKLPPTLRDHVILANVNNQTLTLHTDSQAWASKLRFVTAELLKDAQLYCSPYKPKSIRIKVVPIETVAEATTRSITLSENSAEHIRDVAESMAVPELRTALLKLSQKS